MNDGESEAMWALYGRAIAIQTRYDLLRDAFPRYEPRKWEHDHEQRPSDFGGRLLLGMVRYEDYEARIPDVEYVLPLFYKRRSFAHEQEIRLVMPRFLDGLIAARGVDLAQTSPADLPIKGALVRVDIERLIEKIFVDPRQPDWFLTCVRAVVAKFEPALADRVHQSAMSAPPVF